MNDYIDVEKREIPGYPSYYCDTNGLVYHKNKILKVGYNNGVYGYVLINNRKKPIAKLMGMAWLGASPTDMVGFIDGDRNNTELSNLYITDKSELLSKTYEFKKTNGLYYSDKRLLNEHYKSSTGVYQLDKNTLEIINTFDSVLDAAKFMDVPSSVIAGCCINPSKTCCSFRWCYIERYNYAKEKLGVW